MDKEILVLGNGLLGKEIIKQTNWDCISRGNNKFDITDINTFYKMTQIEHGVIQYNKYDIIINCVADTNTYSEDKENHWKVNYKGVADLVNFCNKWKVKLVHISTDYIYTNSKEEASEKDVPVHSNNWYSYTKLLGDAHVQLDCNNYLICRGTHKPYPFPYKEAWKDQYGNFDYVDVMAKLIIELVKKDAIGIYNIGTPLKSTYELALKSKEVKAILSPKEAPKNVSMNINKLNNFFKV